MEPMLQKRQHIAGDAQWHCSRECGMLSATAAVQCVLQEATGVDVEGDAAMAAAVAVNPKIEASRDGLYEYKVGPLNKWSCLPPATSGSRIL